MAPINTMSPPTDMPDNLRQELESLSTPELEAQFSALDNKMPSVGSNEYNDEPLQVSEAGVGEPISPRDLYSSDQAYEIAASAAHEQVARSLNLRNLGQRLDVFRGEY